MIRMFFPGQLVPEWLEKQVPKKGFENNHKKCVIKFTSVVVVWSYKGKFIIANIIPKLRHVHILAQGGENMIIVGQSPKGGNGGVHHYSSFFSAIGL